MVRFNVKSTFGGIIEGFALRPQIGDLGVSREILKYPYRSTPHFLIGPTKKTKQILRYSKPKLRAKTFMNHNAE